jgi:ATP-dependent protease ClpP protease subunit
MKINKLLQLLRDNAARAEGPVPIRSEVAQGVVDIYVYDVIDPYWGASALGLIDALTAAAGQPVTLHINSPGGDVFEGRAMAAAIAAYTGPVEACIDGLCASAATYLALAAGKVCMVEGGLFMVHNSWTLAYGDKTALLDTANLLDKIDGTIAQSYMRKTGCALDQAVAWMNAETWFTADEALAAKFIDEIEPATQQGEATEPVDRWNLSAYANAPKREAKPQPQQSDLAALAAAADRQLQANRNRLRLYDRI